MVLCFTIYWLIIDSEAVFLFETAYYLNIFFILVVSFYFTMRTLGLWAKIYRGIRNRVAKDN